ncbi:uncharacterized protein [Chironomus tepperi]|uniref:uncharacterized protein n=1 Tax=Chironomus tepperi TaxID=113505 RepID=UPI00391FA5F5
MMKVAGVLLCLVLALELSYAITVKPTNKQPIIENSHVDAKKNPQSKDHEDRVARYLPYITSRHHLDSNVNLVRYLQSLPKANTPIPSIAYLYGNAIKQTPHIQAGFIYKARPEHINKDSYQTATMYPIYNRAMSPGNHHVKYQQLYNHPKHSASVPLPKVKHYTPFSPSNKIPGDWQPMTLPKPTGYVKGHVYNDYISQISLTTDERDEDFIPITTQPLKHVSTPAPEQNYIKSNIKSIKILSPPVHYEQHEKPLIYTTTAKPITISTAKPSQPAENTYEFEEQLIYEYQPSYENKTLNVEVPTKQQHHEYNINPHDLNYENEELTTIQYEIESSSENIKPHINFTRITPVPNVLKIYKHEKEQQNAEINDAETDYYDKDNDNDYDDVIRDGSPGPNSGRPGIDYPNYHKIPETSFSCKEQRYKGFFGDPDTKCQVWHYCDLNGGKSSFLCPNGTIFSQTALTCDWWFNVKCSSTAQLYVLNERLYKFILPFSPKFPQDFQGPLVDKYLTLKFKEMEEARVKEDEEKAAAETSTTAEPEHEENNPVADIVKEEEVIVDTTDNTVDGANDVHHVKAEENPQPHIEDAYPQEPMQELEAGVQIHNFGSTGHLSPLLNLNSES